MGNTSKGHSEHDYGSKYWIQTIVKPEIAPLNLNSIHHVAIIVSDYEVSKDFYVNELGFRVIRENYRPERKDWKLDLACGSIELEIFAEPDPPARVSGPEACGLRHLAFQVA